MSDLIEGKTLCTARRKNGMPCHNAPVNFATVCRMHGGAAPQVKRAAQVRAAMASDRLMATLIKIAEDEAVAPAVRLVAIKDALDRAGITMAQKVEVEVRSWQDVLEGVLVDIDEPSDSNIEEAIVVPDQRAIEQRDAEMIDRERERNRAKRKAARHGVPDHEPPTVNAQPKPAMTAEGRKEHEAFLLNRISGPEPERPVRRRRAR